MPSNTKSSKRPAKGVKTDARKKRKPLDEPNKVGRPSDYRPEYCQKIIEHCREGFSFESFAGLIGVHVDTLYEWEKVHKEFSESKKIAAAVSLYKWEKTGIEALTAPELDEDFEAPRVIENKNEAGEVFKSTINVKTKRRKRFNTTLWIYNMKARHRKFGWNPTSIEAPPEEMGIDVEIIDDDK